MIIIDPYAFRKQMEYLARLRRLGLEFLLSLMVNVISLGAIALIAYSEVTTQGLRNLIVGAFSTLAIIVVLRIVMLLTRPKR